MNTLKCAAVLVCALAVANGQSASDPPESSQTLEIPQNSAGSDGSAIAEAATEVPAANPLIKALTRLPTKVRGVPVAVFLDTPYKPLTVAQKYQFAVAKMTGAGAWPALALRAGLDQFGALPKQWGTGMDSLAFRVASRFGRSFVRQNLAFAIRAADHEDPRYFILGEGNVWHRTKWAIRQTFVARNDNGGWMPAYSRYATNYAVPMIASSWTPLGFSSTVGLRGSSLAFGVNAFSNVCQEFLPDMKRLLRGRPENGGQLARWRAKIH